MNTDFIHLNKSRKKGFTLIEMIIYVFFVGTFSVLALNGVFQAIEVFADFRMTRNLNSTAEVILDRVTREVRQAYDVDQVESSFSAHPGELTLKTIDPSDVDTTVEFYIDSGSVKIKEDTRLPITTVLLNLLKARTGTLYNQVQKPFKLSKSTKR